MARPPHRRGGLALCRGVNSGLWQSPVRCSSSNAACTAADNEGVLNSFGWDARAITYRQSTRAVRVLRQIPVAVPHNAPGIALICMTALKLEARMASALRSNAIEFAKLLWVQSPRCGVTDNGTLHSHRGRSADELARFKQPQSLSDCYSSNRWLTSSVEKAKVIAYSSRLGDEA